MLSSSSADDSRIFRRFFRGRSVSSRFKVKENLQRCGDIFIDILITGNLAIFECISKLYRCSNKRRMQPAPAIKKMDERQRNEYTE